MPKKKGVSFPHPEKHNTFQTRFKLPGLAVAVLLVFFGQFHGLSSVATCTLLSKRVESWMGEGEPYGRTCPFSVVCSFLYSWVVLIVMDDHFVMDCHHFPGS